MKKYVFLFFALMGAIVSFAQKFGIGISVPAFRVDVRGGSINTDSLYRIRSRSIVSINGVQNIFVGDNSGMLNTSGAYNTGCGQGSLDSNTIGSFNTGIGYLALRSNFTGQGNTAFGSRSLLNNKVSNNTGFGNNVLSANRSGTENTAFGCESLFVNVDGNFNTAIGTYALRNTAGADGNTAIGDEAGDVASNGFYNTFVGFSAQAAASDLFNSVALGTFTRVNQPLQIRVGQQMINSIGGYEDWTTISDGRFKKNIREDVKGLAFIMKLRPVTYRLNVSTISAKLNEMRGMEMNQQMKNAISEKEAQVCSGFIAQEVEAAAIETGYDFSGIDKPKNENGFYGLRYAEFVVPLVKAMQEQQQEISLLLMKLQSLDTSIADLKHRLDVLEKASKTAK